ncbi:MAG: hypothetical protein EA369_03885 [Bradymonadales bacterium]|nr:MAG: hypothetical protein EA369_03885 [Bradymonadales bacterium]
MNMKAIKIQIKPTKDFLNDTAKIMKAIQAGKRPKPVKEPKFFFESLDAVRSILTDKRMQLLRLIKKERPSSIKELARLAKRDFKAVYADIQKLEQFDLVQVTKSRPGSNTQVRSKVSAIQFSVEI